LPQALDDMQRTALLIDGFRKPVMGRRSSLEDVKRVAEQIGPIVDASTRQTAVQGGLREMAQEKGVSPETARGEWIRLQEADILLESGGDPDAMSSAGAVGVSQWMPGSGRHRTLMVDLSASIRLTGKINSLKQQIAWLDYWRQPGPKPPVFGITPVSEADATREQPSPESSRH